MPEVEKLLKEMADRMGKAVEATDRVLRTVRTGHADASLLEQVNVDYYGTKTPLPHLATISVPDPRTIMVTPWDKGTVHEVERAIVTSDLGVMPVSDGAVIRIPIPPLTEERRKELAKMIGKRGEEGKVAVRNLRRETIEKLKQMEKDGQIGEDDSDRAQEQVQKRTEEFITKVEHLVESKRQAIMRI